MLWCEYSIWSTNHRKVPRPDTPIGGFGFHTLRVGGHASTSKNMPCRRFHCPNSSFGGHGIFEPESMVWRCTPPKRRCWKPEPASRACVFVGICEGVSTRLGRQTIAKFHDNPRPTRGFGFPASSFGRHKTVNMVAPSPSASKRRTRPVVPFSSIVGWVGWVGWGA